jgi:hypothetical protein
MEFVGTLYRYVQIKNEESLSVVVKTVPLQDDRNHLGPRRSVNDSQTHGTLQRWLFGSLSPI